MFIDKYNDLILLSHILSNNTPSFGDRDKFIESNNSSILTGHSSNTSSWNFSNNHLGTHIDVPLHIDPVGDSITSIPLIDWFFNNITLIDIPLNESKLITVNDINSNKIEKETELLLIRTNYESFRNNSKYWNDNPGIAPEVASFLRVNFSHLRCIGFDFISLTSWKFRSIGKESHKSFLMPEPNESPILIIEDMSLINVRSKIEWVLVSPIFVSNSNGAPVTIFSKLKGTL